MSLPTEVSKIIGAEPSLRESPEQQLRQLLQLLTPRQRFELRAKWFLRDVMHRLPFSRAISGVLWKARRAGWAGIFDPPFNAYTQDRTVYDKRLRWHQWGVLREPSGFRAYTPTRRTAETFVVLDDAWGALKVAYDGGPNDFAWEPLGNRNDGSGTKKTEVQP